MRDRDIEGVLLNVHPSVEVKGTLSLNGSYPGSNNSMKVGLQPVGSSSRLPNYQGVLGRAQAPGVNGAFAIPGVAEGVYRVQVLNLPANAYIDEVRQGGRQVYDSGLVVENKSPDVVEVTVNSNGGSILGSVTTLDRKPSVSSTVVLIPDPPHRENTGLYKTATTDTQGHFTLRGIRPGTYRLMAWEVVPAGAYLNSVFLSKYEARGTSVNVVQQSSNTVELTVIPRN